MKAVEFATASLSEIALMLRWAAEEGWNPGLDDAAAFHASDAQGFFVARQDGVPVAAISVVNHSDRFSFLGLYLCRPEYRGKGIGFGLWRHALDHAGDRTVGLDGVPAQEANYAKSGFVLTGRTRRLQGVLPVSGSGFSPALASDLDALKALDAAANGFDRPAFVSAWTADCRSRKTVVMRDGDRLTGFATARICQDGCKVGPVVAPTSEDALRLVHEAAAAVGATQVIVDTSDQISDLGALLEARGFVETFSTARMYRGTAPIPGDNLHAIATMELG